MTCAHPTCASETSKYRWCRSCREVQKKSKKKRRIEWILAWLCSRCGQHEPRPGFKTCDPCRAWTVKYMRRRRALEKEKRDGQS